MDVQAPTPPWRDTGLAFKAVERPESSQQVSELLRAASESGTTVVPIGGGCSLSTGCIVDSQVTGLDLTAMAGIDSYEPADLTVSVRAGTRVADLQDELRRHGQELPIDVPFPSTATIGGLVATGFAGPRRLRSGSLRDLLIGCEYVRGDGLVAKAGGMVVKNVSGFEIPRLLHGSWGSLAVLSSVNLKVNPIPRHEATLRFPSDGVETAIQTIRSLLAQFSHIDAATTVSAPENTWNQVRFLGRPRAVDQSIAECRDALRGTEVEAFEGNISLKFWQSAVGDSAEISGRLVVAYGCRPSEMDQLVADLQESLAERTSATLHISPGTGAIRVVDQAENWEPMGVERLLDVARTGDRRAVVESAPTNVRQSVPVWGAPTDGVELMQAIKRQFDPAGILNRGRLFI